VEKKRDTFEKKERKVGLLINGRSDKKNNREDRGLPPGKGKTHAKRGKSPM